MLRANVSVCVHFIAKALESERAFQYIATIQKAIGNVSKSAL